MTITTPLLTIVAILMMLAGPATAQEKSEAASANRNGKWWRSFGTPANALPGDARALYVLGILDGLGSGALLMMFAAPGEKQADVLDRQRRYREAYTNVAGKTTAIALVRGLDTLYGDAKNIGVHVNVASVVVLMRLNGAPEAIVERLLQRGRAEGAALK